MAVKELSVCVFELLHVTGYQSKRHLWYTTFILMKHINCKGAFIDKLSHLQNTTNYFILGIGLKFCKNPNRTLIKKPL